ncbi:MAG: ACT domain-containing protein [Planctomycetota bacterium]|jgi:hypothetical protein
MVEATQFCVGLEHKPGMLAKLCEALRRANVNIDALCVSDDKDCCWVNLVTTPSEAADRALAEGGFRYLAEKVLILQIGNQPGTLAQVAATLAKANVNINYIYGAGTDRSPCMLVFNVDDPARAMKALGSTQTEKVSG